MTSVAFKSVSKAYGPDPVAALALRAEGLSKDEIRQRTGNTLALDAVSLEIGSGETFVVMGLSGSGKSTLVRLANRLIEPDAGDVLIGQRSVLGLSAHELRRLRREQVSMVFQSFALFPHKSVAANVSYGLDVRAADRAEARAAAAQWIEKVGLSGYEDALPAELSGGMQQRVGLARALATEPKVLLMDEPFGALDPLIRREMQNELLALRRELSATLLFITHDLGEALRLGHRIAVLRDGAVVQVAAPDTLLAKPADDYVRAFVRTLDRRPESAADGGRKIRSRRGRK